MRLYGEEFTRGIATPHGLRSDEYYLYPQTNICIDDLEFPQDLAGLLAIVAFQLQEEAKTPPLAIILALGKPQLDWTPADDQYIRQQLDAIRWPHGKIKLLDPQHPDLPLYKEFLDQRRLSPSRAVILVSDPKYQPDPTVDPDWLFARFN